MIKADLEAVGMNLNSGSLSNGSGDERAFIRPHVRIRYD
jgi:hypothetical protein